MIWRFERLGRLAFTIVLLAIGSLPAAAEDPYSDKRTKIAAIISMGAYKNTDRLKNPPNDAALITQKMEAAGFTVMPMADLPLAGLKPAIDGFLNQAKGADIALVYYAGHAVQIDGENYMVPVDFNTNNPDILGSLFPVKALVEGLNTAAKARVLLLDACRDNPFQSALKTLLGDRASGQGLAAIQMPVVDGRTLPIGTHGLVVSYATQPQIKALDGAGSNSPYAKALAESLANPESDLNTLLVRTTNTVLSATKGKQRPEHRMALTGPLYLVSRQKPYQCDVLAVEPDNDMSVTGVDFDEIDAAKALPACEADLAKNPDNPRLMHNYGKALERSGRLKEAVEYYRKSAERGYDWGQLYLSVVNMEATGIPQDMKEGVYWLRKAFEQGNRQALVTYTEMDVSGALKKPWRVKILQKALREAGIPDVPDTETFDDATIAALDKFIEVQGIENKTITFQVLDRLGIVEAFFPKKDNPTGDTANQP